MATIAPASLAPEIIDLHCHAAGIGAGGSGCYVSPRLLRSYKFGFYLRAFGVDRQTLETRGDRVVIDRIAEGLAASREVHRAVVLALDGCVDSYGRLDLERTELLVPDDFVADAAARHPALLFGASVHPRRPDALDRLRRASARGAVLVKWLPAIQDIDPSAPSLVPYYEELARLGLPLLTHTGTEHSFSSARDRYSDPELLRLPLEIGVTVIAAHAATSGRYGGERAIERLARLALRFPNLYADISALTLALRLGGLVEAAQRPEFEGRLLHGTDYPLVAMPSLTSPLYAASRIGLAKARSLAAIENAWDRDLALKRAFGVDETVFTRAASLLRLPVPATAAA